MKMTNPPANKKNNFILSEVFWLKIKILDLQIQDLFTIPKNNYTTGSYLKMVFDSL
jgi:hypothetical protein